MCLPDGALPCPSPPPGVLPVVQTVTAASHPHATSTTHMCAHVHMCVCACACAHNTKAVVQGLGGQGAREEVPVCPAGS